MGYLRKEMVINALKEDMEDTKKCYEGYQEKLMIAVMKLQCIVGQGC